MNTQRESTLPPCCEATTAWVREHAIPASCPDCGEQYGPVDRPALLPVAPTVPMLAPQRTPGAQPDARVQVAHDPRPSSTAPVARLTHVEDAELVRVRRLLTELRPDKGGPLGWAADGTAPVAMGSNWTPALRVQTSVEVPAILPGAFQAQAPESRVPRLDPATTLGWLQRAGTLAAGLRALYAACADACATAETRAAWKALGARERLAAAVIAGRKLVLAAMAEWWRETPAVDPEAAEAEAQALRSAQWAEVAGLVTRQTERASEATGEALARALDTRALPVSNAAIGLPLPAVDVRPAPADDAHDPASAHPITSTA